MARLQIEQVAAPNQSAAAALLAGAGQSFNQGLSAASSLLDKYAEGQQASGDQAVIADLAALNSEEELGAYLQSGALNGANLSPEMRQNILGLRDNIIGYGQSRADIRQTEANIGLTNANTGLVGANTNRVNVNTTIAQAAEGRTAAEYQDGVATRDQMRALTPLALAAGEEGRQYGQPVAPEEATQDTRLLLARTIQMEAGNQGFEGMKDVGAVIRNRAASGRYGEGIEGVILRPGQFSAWNGVTGYAGGEQGQNTNFTPNEQALAAADAILSGQYEDRTGGATHYYAVLENSPAPSWTNDTFRQIDGDHYFGDADGVGAINGNNGPIASAPVQATAPQRPSNGAPTPAMTALQEAIAASPNISFEQAQQLITNTLAQQQAGQTQLDATALAAAQDSAAQTTIDALQDPNILNAGGVAAANLGNQDLTPSQQLAALDQGRSVAEGNQDILAPATTVDPLVAAQAASDERTRQRGVDALPQTRILATAERYGDDAIGGLVADLGIGADGENARSYVFGLFGENTDENQLRQHINSIAEQAGVTPAMAAAAMADEFNRDPWGINRNARRFDPASVVEHLNATVGPEGMQAYEGALVAQETADARSEGAQLQIQTLQSQLAKATDPRRREQLQNSINQLTDQTLGGVTPQQATQQLENYVRGQAGMAARLREARALLDENPESTEAFRAISDLETQIQGDTELSDREKQLLIATLRG